MIPYFQFLHFNLGPVTIQVWGLCVAAGLLAAAFFISHLAKKYLLSKTLALDLVLWATLGGFVGARLGHVLFYSLDYYLARPIEILYVWHGGLSSFGGFTGAVIAVWIFAKVRRLKWKEFLPYADILTHGLWLGWGIGRLGCFLIHDHPGTLTHFIGAVQYPGGARHDLGLYESILGFLLFGFCYLVFPKFVKKQWGLVTAVSWLLYAVARFGLDFLRASDLPGSDARYSGLTPAQWGMAALVLALTFLLVYGTMRRQTKTGEVA